MIRPWTIRRNRHRYKQRPAAGVENHGAGQTRYVNDTAGRLIYEQTGNGSARNYVWLGDNYSDAGAFGGTR
ncbi:hypothetical protein [Methylomonas sp. HYX-M1]|uniref:hypothetical protein n=1 Tax=Methylomonas sp. HYX-M1 TaxID=3139307 RepID=UPI00345B89D0